MVMLFHTMSGHGTPSNINSNKNLLKMADQLQNMALQEFNIKNNIQQSHASVKSAQQIKNIVVTNQQVEILDNLFKDELVLDEHITRNVYAQVDLQFWQ